MEKIAKITKYLKSQLSCLSLSLPALLCHISIDQPCQNWTQYIPCDCGIPHHVTIHVDWFCRNYENTKWLLNATITRVIQLLPLARSVDIFLYSFLRIFLSFFSCRERHFSAFRLSALLPSIYSCFVSIANDRKAHVRQTNTMGPPKNSISIHRSWRLLAASSWLCAVLRICLDFHFLFSILCCRRCCCNRMGIIDMCPFIDGLRCLCVLSI